MISLIAVILISTSILFIGDIWYISIIIMVVGLFFGLIHGTALKIMLEYGTAKNTAKYSTINEILIGMGFGITPIIAGYVVEINIYAIFTFIAIFGLVILIFLIYLSRNIKKDKIR
jgi:MFS family permease